MSANGDMIGTSLISGRAAAQVAFSVATHGQKLTPALIAQEQLALVKSDGAVIDSAIQSAVAARGGRIFVGTDPHPDPTQFQNGDIYFLREE